MLAEERRPRNVQTSAALTGWRELLYPSQRKQGQRLDSNTGFNQSCGARKLPLNRPQCFTSLSSQNPELQKKMLVFQQAANVMATCYVWRAT